MHNLGNPDSKQPPITVEGLKPPAGGPLDDAVEEELVVGILGGKGLPLSENAYRCQKKYRLRTTYHDVGITEDKELENWLNTGAELTTTIYDALRRAGLSERQAKYVANI